jgi:hypothetical protein
MRAEIKIESIEGVGRSQRVVLLQNYCVKDKFGRRPNKSWAKKVIDRFEPRFLIGNWCYWHDKFQTRRFNRKSQYWEQITITPIE